MKIWVIHFKELHWSSIAKVCLTKEIAEKKLKELDDGYVVKEYKVVTE